MNNFLDFLKENSKKSSLFYNDFSNIYYIVNNQDRVWQLEYELFNICKHLNISGLIPPRIVNYQYAFLELACLLKYGKNFDRNNMTLFSNEWIRFLMLETVRKIYENESNIRRYSSKENIVKYLSRQIEVLLKNISFYLKKPNDIIEKLKNSTSENTKKLIETLEKYPSVVSSYQKDNIFTTPKDAYEWLLNNANAPEFRKKMPDIKIFIEDYDMLEPIFQKISDRLQITKITTEDKNKVFPILNDKETIEIYAFNVIYDEAESIVASVIKDMKEENIPNHRIVIVPFNNELKKLLNLTFLRWGLTLKNEVKLGETDEYKLFYLAYSFKTGLFKGSVEKIFDLFTNNISSFKLSNIDLISLIKKEFYEYGIQIEREEGIEIFKKVLDKNKDEILKNETEKKENLKWLLEKPNSLLKPFEVLEKVIDSESKKANIKVMEMLYDISEEIEKIGPKTNEDIMLLIELAASRQVFLKTEKIEGNENEISANFFIPIISPEKIKSFTFDKIYLCGLDATFDKKPARELPKEIEDELGLKSPDDKKKEIFDTVIKTVQNSKKLWISYSYHTSSARDVAGISSLYLVIKDMIKNNNDEIDLNNGYLWKYTDFINEKSIKKLPVHPSYTYNEVKKTSSNSVPYNEQIELLTLYDYINLAKKTGDEETPLIHFTELAEFGFCPRKFVLRLFDEVAGIKKEDIEGVVRMSEGKFWHSVLEYAARLDDQNINEDFNSANKERIKKALQKGFDTAKKNWSDRINKFVVSDDYLEKAFELYSNAFAEKEAERRNKGFKTVKIEVEIETELELKDNKKIKLKGRIDRIDEYENSYALIIDYKKDKKNIITNEIINKDKIIPFFVDQDSLQISLYTYFYKKDENKEKIPLIISYQNGASSSLTNNTNNPYTIKEKIEALIKRFKEFCSMSIITVLEHRNTEFHQLKHRNTDPDQNCCRMCKNICTKEYGNYCDYKDICFLMEYTQDRSILRKLFRK